MNVNEMISKMSLEEKASVLSGYDFWHTAPVESAGLDKFMMCDGPNGLRKQVGKADHLGVNKSISTVCYPTAASVASGFDVDMARELGERLGDECRRENVSMLLGPGLNMKRSPVCGRNFEYYSEDPCLAGEIAAAYVEGVQSKNIAACPKHFAANNQEYRRMSGNSIVDERTLHEIYLAAFETVVKKAKPKSIMCSYNKLNGTYLSENKYMLTDVLRDKWGFDGFVVTDWGAGKNPEKGVEAGLDLVMPGPNKDHTEAIVAAVKEGRLLEEKVDKAVKNILEVMDWTTRESTEVKTKNETDYEFAVRLAAESAVLLKNDNKALPIRKKRKVLFVGEFAKSPRYQGSGSSHINSAFVSNAYDSAIGMGYEISFAQGYDSKDSSRNYRLREEAALAAEEVDEIVIFAGLPASYESEGFDRKDINLPKDQDKLINDLSNIGKKTVVVMHNGAPVAMPWIDRIDAVLEMQLSGDGVGEATAKLLYGEVSPSGKLAETYPIKLSDNPSYLNFPGEGGNPVYAEGIFIGYRYYEKKKMPVLFTFGHGLSYTEFEYTNMELSSDRIKDTDTLKVSVEIWNVGGCKGKEVVQLYVSDNVSKVTRPVKELKAFKKVELSPGEKEVVEFILDKRAFAYYDSDLHDFHVESGDFTIMVGASSDDIRHADFVYVESTEVIPRHFDLFTPVADILESPKGKEILKPLFDSMEAGSGADQDDAMGEGGSEMMKNMILDMPIMSLASFGIMEPARISEIIDQING